MMAALVQTDQMARLELGSEKYPVLILRSLYSIERLCTNLGLGFEARLPYNIFPILVTFLKLY